MSNFFLQNRKFGLRNHYFGIAGFIKKFTVVLTIGKHLFFFVCCLLLAFPSSAQQLVLIKDLVPGSQSSQPSGLTVWNGKLYFFAADTTGASALWSYDEIAPPVRIAAGGGGDFPTQPAVFNDKLYFPALSAKGIELFAYNGTTAPVLVADVDSSVSRSSSPRQLVVVGGKLFFAANSTFNTIDLYGFDGTQLRRITPLIIGNNGAEVTAFNGRVYFTTNSINYEVDPATYSLSRPLFMVTPYSMVVANANLFFVNGQNGALYNWSGSGTPNQLTSYGINGIRRLFGRGLLSTDGAIVYFAGVATTKEIIGRYNLASGTVDSLFAIYSDPSSGYPPPAVNDMLAMNGSLFIAASIDSAVGLALYQYKNGTLSLAANISTPLHVPTSLTAYNGHLYFVATTSSLGAELYRLADGVGVQNVGWEGKAYAYPNPASQSNATLVINLPKAQKLSIRLTDATGSVVYNIGHALQAGRSTVSLPLKSLPAGRYYYHISDEKGRSLQSAPVIKQ